MLASLMLLLLFTSGIYRLSAQTPVVINPWANLNSGPIITGPRSIKVDANGNIYTANYNISTISKVTPSGVVTPSWATLAPFAQPYDISFDANGNLYSVNYNHNTVSKITPAGVITQAWATLAAGAQPYAVATDINGNVYTANYGNSTVSKITPTGVVTQAWATYPANSRPAGIIIDNNGNVYTANTSSSTVSKITPTGVATHAWATLDPMAAPQRLVLDNNGNIYTTNAANNTVSKITSAGVVTHAWATLAQNTTVFPPNGANPIGIAFDAVSGSIFTANAINYTISKIGVANGSTIQNWVTGLNAPSSLITSQGNLYVANGYGGTISKVVLPGAFDITFNQTSPTCSNSSNGGLRAIPSGTCGTGYQFLWTSGGFTTDTINNLAPGTYSVRVVCGTDTVNKPVTLTASTVVAAPSTSNQTLCNGATVADLAATPASGNTIVWYASATGGTALPNSTTLVNGTKYYAAQVTPSNCESSVRAVDSVTITATVAAREDSSYCNGSTIAVNFVGASGNTYIWTATQNGTGIAASGTGNSSFTGVNNTNAVVTDTVIVSSSFNTCTPQKDTFAISVLPTPKVDSIANMQVCPGTTVPAINFTTPTTGGTVGYKWTNSNTAIGLAASGFSDMPSFTAAATAQSSTISVRPYMLKSATDTCFGTVRTFNIAADLPAAPTTTGNLVVYTGTKTISQLAVTSLAGGTLNYYYEATGGTALPVTTAVADDTTYFVSQTVNGCESNPRKQIKVNRIANDSIVLCNPATVANLVTTPNAGNAVKWYSSATAIDTLAYNTDINTGTNTLYVEEFSTVVSNRVPVTVIVNPIPNVLPTADTIVCNGSTIPAINFATTTSGTVTYNWTNNNTSMGLAASGTGNIASFVATNPSTLPLATTATIIVTPTISNAGISCEGVKDTFLITVNPTIGVRVIANQVVCNGSPTTAVSYGGPRGKAAVVTAAVVTIVYNWANNTPSIGLAASGTGVIPSFTAVNNGNAPVIATIVITPSYTNNGVTCDGTPRTFTITVNPTATIDTVANQAVCNGANTTAINFSSPTAGGTIVYDWTNNNTNIGLAASGTGNIASFAATNSGTAPDTATITITPFYTNAGVTCTGIVQTFTITVNPTATVDTIFSEVVCNGTSVASVSPTSPTTGGTVTYVWTNTNTDIGLTASGAGNVPGFTATNTSAAPITATITITPIFTNAGVSCTGTPQTYTVTVNPTATVNTVNNQIVCNGSAVTAVNFSTTATGGTVTYAWTNSNTTIGLSASGSGNIASFTATNNGTAPAIATITVTPTFTNAGVSCQGTAQTFTITVNPTATVNAISNQTVCNGAAVSAVNFATTATGGTVMYAWTNSNASIGLAASGTGNIASFNAINNSHVPVTATIIVTPTFTNAGVSCTGTAQSFTVTINPTAVVNAVNNQTVCADATNSTVNFSAPVAGTTYSWTNSNPSIGLAASGSGNVPSFVAVNPSPNAVTATITVTPNTAAGCIGQAITYTITVNGKSVAPTSISNPTPIVCANNAFATLSVNGGALGIGAVWKWYADSLNTVSIGSGATLSNIAVAKTTTYFVRAEGTCNNTTSASVVVQRANLVSHVRQHWSDVLLFDNSSKNFVAWQWYKNGVAVNSATLQQYSESSALVGTYYVVATDKNGAQSVSCPLTITAGSFTGLKIGMFPNPADKGAIVMVTTSFTVSELQGANITVTDVYGRVLQQITQVTPNTTIKAPATTGIYVVTLTLQSGIKYSANLLTK